MTSVRRTVTVLAHVDDHRTAVAAAADLARVLDTVWIADGIAASRVHRGIYSLRVKVTAPAHELTNDAPIIARAIRALGVPADSVRIVS